MIHGKNMLSGSHDVSFCFRQEDRSMSAPFSNLPSTPLTWLQMRLRLQEILPPTMAVLQMGFQQALVRSLVQSRYLLTGNQYTSVADLLADVLQAEQEEEEGHSTGPVARQGNSAGGMTTQASTGEKVHANQSTEEQLRQLQEERTCKVCMDKQVSMVFVPCGHLVVCRDCATSLHHCPICRALIRGSVRAFLS